MGSRENCASILCYRGTKGVLERAKYCWMCQSLRVTMGMLTGEQPKTKDGGPGRKLEAWARQKSTRKRAQARRPPVHKHTLLRRCCGREGLKAVVRRIHRCRGSLDCVRLRSFAVSKVCVNGSYGCGSQYWTLESEGNVFHGKTKGLGNCVEI